MMFGVVNILLRFRITKFIVNITIIYERLYQYRFTFCIIYFYNDLPN